MNWKAVASPTIHQEFSTLSSLDWTALHLATCLPPWYLVWTSLSSPVKPVLAARGQGLSPPHTMEC